MASKVTSLDEMRIKRQVEQNEPCHETVVAALEQALADLKNGNEIANKAIIILLHDEGPLAVQNPEIYLAGLSPLEGVGLCILARDDCTDIARGFADLDV